MNKKRLKIMDTGRQLFWKYGLKRVSVEEICIQSGVSKMTFYKHFENKLELARAILDQLFSDSLAEYNQIMQSNLPYAEKVKLSIAQKLKTTSGVSQELINEFYKSGEPGLVDYMHQKATEALAIFIADFKKLQQTGEVRSDINPEFVIYMLGKMNEITTDEKFTGLFAGVEEMVRTLTTFFFFGIMPETNFKG